GGGEAPAPEDALRVQRDSVGASASRCAGVRNVVRTPGIDLRRSCACDLVRRDSELRPERRGDVLVVRRAGRRARAAAERDARYAALSAAVSLLMFGSSSSAFTTEMTVSAFAAGHRANPAQPRNLSASSS